VIGVDLYVLLLESKKLYNHHLFNIQMSNGITQFANYRTDIDTQYEYDMTWQEHADMSISKKIAGTTCW